MGRTKHRPNHKEKVLQFKNSDRSKPKVQYRVKITQSDTQPVSEPHKEVILTVDGSEVSDGIEMNFDHAEN